MMDTQRLILFFVFSFSLLMLWEAWQKEARGPQAPAASAPQAVPSPTVPTPGTAPKTPPAAAAPSVPAGDGATGSRERVRVTTDMFVAEIDTQGGDIVHLELLKHKDANDHAKNVVLLGPEHRYASQSGLIGPGLPNHRTPYTTQQKQAALAAGADLVEVRLNAPGPDGVKVTKTLTFRRGSYVIDIAYRIDNGSSAPVSGHSYYQLVRDGKSPAGENAMAYVYTGPAVYTEQDKFQKVAFGDIDKGKTPYSRSADNGWVAMIQHYFVAAILPPDKTPREYYTRKLAEDHYSVGVIVPVAAIPPGGSGTVSVPMYAGAQEHSRLKEAAPSLDLVVDYGFLTVIAAPLFWVLQLFHRWTANWGIAIVLLTVVIKLIFFPLSAASYRSMAKMKLVAPRLTKIRETYPDDRMKQNQAMMELYKTEKINPLGGCLPILVQIPVFIALYWVLLAAVELRQAPFYGWIRDLSLPDPWFVLPALMMASMIIQTRMNPTPPDPVQAKVMMIMPFAFGIMFFFFPAGLVLYWLVNNVLSILQQWQITRMIEGAQKTAVAAKR
jgi:YidC/Oxa1 family membrane protein insertase